MNRKRMIGLLAAVMLSAGIAPVSVHAEEEINKCGDNLSWTLEEGVLTISGQGDMYNWKETPDPEDSASTEASYAPWHDQASSIRSVIVETGVTSVGDEFLKDAYRASSISLPDSLTYIGAYSFAGTAISEMRIPDAVETVGAGAFMTCDYLESISIGSGMTEISDMMVSDCFSLTQITVPENITKIGSGAFANCDGLTSLTMTDHVKEIGSYAFFRDTNLTDLTLTQSITQIEEYTFAGCGIKELTIPDGVTEIGKYAIADAAIETIVIPDSVDIIRAYGLCSPTYLKEVVFQGHAPKSMYAFLFKDNVIKAYYPVNDTSWTAVKKGQYSGTVTWIPLECREGHDYEESVTAPTVNADGQITRTCKVCGDSSTQVLPKLSTDLSVMASKASGDNRIKFTGQVLGFDENADHSSIVEHGILYIRKTKLGAKTLTTATSGRTKVSFTGYKADGSFCYTISVPSDSCKYVARSYTIVKDGDGKLLTFYSPECCVSCAGLQ